MEPQLAKLNNIADPNKINAGATLKIPDKGSSISAREHRTKPKEISRGAIERRVSTNRPSPIKSLSGKVAVNNPKGGFPGGKLAKQAKDAFFLEDIGSQISSLFKGGKPAQKPTSSPYDRRAIGRRLEKNNK